jgi:PTH1 family peptidyl-tRNA hydrolase
VVEEPIRLLVGLGNPGPRYQQTRHNVGFWLVEEVARLHGGQFRSEARFHGDVCRVSIEGADVWLLKPLTFMNRSGQAVRALAQFYKIEPRSILVVHDELDLAPGTVRFKRDGGHGGHNGLRDIHAHLGSPGYRRLRLGIGHPGQASQVVDYVLSKPSPDDRGAIEQGIDRAMSELPRLMTGDFASAMNALHSR